MQSSATFTLETDGDVAILHVGGFVDIGNHAEFSSAIENAATGAPRGVIVDFGECPYLDSTGLSALVRAHRLFGPRLRLVVLAESRVARLMEITGLRRAFTVHATIASASAAAEEAVLS